MVSGSGKGVPKDEYDTRSRLTTLQEAAQGGQDEQSIYETSNGDGADFWLAFRGSGSERDGGW